MIGRKIGALTIVRQLGEGGMGAVYLAEHESLRSKRGAKQYAVKILHPHWSADRAMVQRFVGEASAAASIQHDNIVEIHDRGELPDGSQYIVMDFVEGKTLGAYCQEHGLLSPHDLVYVLGPTASALKAAHELGIIHRDLKPENILIVAGKRNRLHPQVLDWGIAKLSHEGGSQTRTGQVAGTPHYMAPEQMLDFRAVDHRADIYSLGVIAYQVLTGGWLPHQKTRDDDYTQASMPAILLKLTQEDPIDPRQRLPSIPARLANVIMASINRDPARRPQSVATFALMIAQAVEADAFSKSGVQILEDVAPDLLQIGNLTETVRAPLPASNTAGNTRAFPYQLGELLGRGGMAEVYLATYVGAEGVRRPVAIKRVLDGFSSVPQFASMFVDEARLAARLIHPNIVSVISFDRDPTERLYLAMELVEGRDLAALAKSGPLPFSVIIFVIGEMLRGLEYAHDLPLLDGPQGLVHRDVSPQNVLLSWEGAVKVSDFGIAKARNAAEATASTLIKGKPRYMSPEQASGAALDGRSDLFAVGIMLWELLVGTGQNLFDGTTNEALHQVHTRPIVPPSSLPSVRRGIPSDLEAVTMRLLERSPDRRYAKASHVIEALAACRDFPRNGPAELSRTLAERFPEAVAARTSRPRITPPGSVDAVTKREQPTRKDAAANTWPQQSESTFRSATGQTSSQQSPPPRSVSSLRTVLFGGAAIIIAIGVMVTVGVVYKRRGTESTIAPAVPAAAATGTADETLPATPQPLPPSPSSHAAASQPRETGSASSAPPATSDAPKVSTPTATTVTTATDAPTVKRPVTTPRPKTPDKRQPTVPNKNTARPTDTKAGSGSAAPTAPRFNPVDVGGD